MTTAWDAIAVGERHHFGAYDFTPERIKDFARQFDPQPFHVDEVAAAQSVFGGLIASGWHTAAVATRLYVDYYAARARRGEPVPRFGVSPGVDNLKWLKPVFAGDRISYSGTVSAKRLSASRPGWGLVAFDFAGENQNGEPVFAMTGHVFVAM